VLILVFSLVLAIQNDQKHPKGARFLVLEEFGESGGGCKCDKSISSRIF
jgi:hypothetical protein